ncbi:MAG: DNA polymerase IV [Bacillota bacterium]|nr:DNA polymerase IV [Bacillota bacterium]
MVPAGHPARGYGRFLCRHRAARSPGVPRSACSGGRHGQNGAGVVSTCSYEARRFGIRSAMPLSQAQRLCPHAIFLPVDLPHYVGVSRQLHALLQSFSPLVEQASLDEAYLDLTRVRDEYPSLRALGRAIQERIRKELALSASIGISFNKFAAKVASDLEKPGGLTVIEPADFARVVLPLPLERIPGVGERTAHRLRSLGARTIGDVKALPKQVLRSLFGRAGEEIYYLVRGLDLRPVKPEGQPRSVGHELTFPCDLQGEKELRQHLDAVVRVVAARLAEKGLQGRTVTLKARLAGFTSVTRRLTLDAPTSDRALLRQVAHRLLSRLPHSQPVRLLGVAVGELSSAQQLTLFP